MSLKQRLQDELKAAMLARDSFTTDVIKGLKSAVLYAEVAAGKREAGLSDDEIITVFKKESKKRQESADLYTQGGNTQKADQELREKAIVDAYLPAQLDEAALNTLIDSVQQDMGMNAGDKLAKQDMGKIIGAAKAKGGASVDGSVLARLVASRLVE